MRNKRCLQVSSAGGCGTAGVQERKPFQLSTRRTRQAGWWVWVISAKCRLPGSLMHGGLAAAANQCRLPFVFMACFSRAILPLMRRSALLYFTLPPQSIIWKLIFWGERRRLWLLLRKDCLPAGWTRRLSGPNPPPNACWLRPQGLVTYLLMPIIGASATDDSSPPILALALVLISEAAWTNMVLVFQKPLWLEGTSVLQRPFGFRCRVRVSRVMYERQASHTWSPSVPQPWWCWLLNESIPGWDGPVWTALYPLTCTAWKTVPGSCAPADVAQVRSLRHGSHHLMTRNGPCGAARWDWAFISNKCVRGPRKPQFSREASNCGLTIDRLIYWLNYVYFEH